MEEVLDTEFDSWKNSPNIISSLLRHVYNSDMWQSFLATVPQFALRMWGNTESFEVHGKEILRQESPKDRKRNTELFIAVGEAREGPIAIGLVVYFSQYMSCIMNTLAHTHASTPSGSVYIILCV
jgi:hypothetical protein